MVTNNVLVLAVRVRDYQFIDHRAAFSGRTPPPLWGAMRGSDRPRLGAPDSPFNRPFPALFSLYPISKAQRSLENMVSSLSRNWWLVANGEQQSAQNSAGIQTLLDVGLGCMLSAAWKY